METAKKKIAIIGTVGLPAQYGGFETLTDHIIRNLGENFDFTVYCSGQKYKKGSRPDRYLNARLKYLPFNANGFQSIIYDTISIINSLFYADVLLVLGVAGAWILPFVWWFSKKKVIVSIDGVEWKREKWNLPAKLYLWWAESMAVKYSHIDISDNESIQDYTAVRYKSLSRIVEYGADHVNFVKPNARDIEKYDFLNSQYCVKVCRIEPENNVHVVLEAFTKLNFKLVMIGNWSSSNYGSQLQETYKGKHSNIILLDPIYDQRELDLIRGNASLYVHGHSAGGTNPSLVEAMYLGLPVLAFNVSYNRTTTEGRAAYFKTVEDLRLYINNAKVHDLEKLALSMKEIAKRRYTWRYISNKYDILINEAIAQKAKSKVEAEVASLDIDVLHQNNVAHLLHSNLFYEKRNKLK